MAKVDLSRARELYPSCQMGAAEWNAFFNTSDGLRSVGRIIYDIFDEVKSQQERAAGIRRVGRRPARSAVNLEDVLTTILPPDFNNEPLPVVLPKLIGKRSHADVAAAANLSRSHITHLVRGRTPTLEALEGLAQALGVQPWFFVEWRALYIGQLMTEVLIASPHLGTTVLKDMRSGRLRHDQAVRA
jgi:hypothetical protein